MTSLTSLNPQLCLSVLGALFVAYMIFSLGRITERHWGRNTTPVTPVPVKPPRREPLRTVPRQAQPSFDPNDLTGLRTPEEIARALAAEINKGKKGNPDRVEFLVSLTNAAQSKLRVVS